MLNLPDLVSSPKPNHIIMAGECSENDPRLNVYCIIKLSEEIRELTSTGVKLGGKLYDTEVSLFPADQKFHAHLAGELSNAATYPSSYANVKKFDLASNRHSILPGQFSRWKAWGYKQRLAVATKVSEYK